MAKTGKLPDHGATLSITIPGQGLKFTPRQAYVWVPPAWFAPSHAKLPVIELLHGTPGQPSDWTRAIYADQTSLAYAKQHNGVAPILVMPDINGSLTGDTECANSAMFGQVETYLTQTVPDVHAEGVQRQHGSGLDRDRRAFRGRPVRRPPWPSRIPRRLRGLRQLLG